ncbi:hypothetical protein ACLKA6_000913 [Drosophila palustris]
MLSKKRPSACADKCTQTSSFNSHEHRVTFMVPDSDSNLPDLSFLPAIPLHRQMQQPQYETHNLKQVTNRKKIRWQTYKAKQKELKKALLSSVVSNSSDWRPYAEVSLLNKTLSGLMDTGASISCIGEYMEIKASVERNKSQLPDIKVLDNYVYRRSEHASGDAVADDLCWKLWIPVSMVPEETGTPQKSDGILDSSTSAEAAAIKPGQCSNATTAMVTMPAGHANAGAGPSKPAFHPGLGVDGVILPPPDALKSKQSAKSAAEAPVGAGTAGKPPTASVGKRFSFTEKRSAGHVLQRHYANAGSNLSADWLKKVEWAKQVLPDYTEQSPRAQAQAKRQRSQEAPGPSAKKSRVQPGRSFAQIAKERILIGVLDQGNADGRIPRNQWKWVETALATRCFEMLESEPGPPPICKDVGWYQGNVKVIACDDERSAELYKAAVSKVGEVYPGAKLVAIDWKDVPVRPRARLWIPSSMKEPDKLLLMLQRCNPSLPTHDWKVAKIEEMPGPTSQAVMILNKESLAPIDAAGGELNFGFSSVFIRVYKSDATQANGLSDKPTEEDITEELEAPERPELDGYVSDASTITRELSALCTMADQEVTLDVASDDEDANQTVVEVLSSDVPKDSADKPPSLFSNGDNTAVSLELHPAPIRLLSCYMAYDHPGPPPEIITRRLVDDCVKNNIGLIMGCDANAHHAQWGSTNINTRGYLKREDDTWTTSSEESLDALLSKHFPGCSIHKTGNQLSPEEVPLCSSLLSTHNVSWAINSFQPFKSPGPDGISPAHLQYAGNTATNWLQAIFIEVFKTGYIPEPWRLSKVVFIPKAGKASHVNPKDFRPISLTSFLLKTFERILALHLKASIPTELISSSQHAYRKGRSTETALHSVIATIEKSLSLKEYTLIAFLDIEGAFNNVFPEAITGALLDLGIESRLVGLISQLLKCRAVTSSLGSSTLTREDWSLEPPGQPDALSFYTDGSKLNNKCVPSRNPGD